MTTKVAKDKVSSYGILKPKTNEDIFEILDLVEKPSLDVASSNLGIIGRYVLTPDIFDYLKLITPGANNEIQLTDAIKLMTQNDSLVVYGLKCNDSRFDVGNPKGYVLAIIHEAFKRDWGYDPKSEIEKLNE